ncbi:MAG: mechanosensitive ion channel domain-containing protein [Rickettsiaceae bacterium]
MGSQYIRKHCRLGETITLGTIQGIILEINQTSIILETDLGRTIIPAKEFLETTTNFSSSYSNLTKEDHEQKND